MPSCCQLVLRTVALVGGCAALSGVAWRLSAPPLQVALAAGTTAGFAEVVTAGCAAALLLCVAWLLLTTSLELTARLLQALAPGGLVARTVRGVVDRCTPTASRRLVGLALGLAVGAGAAGPAVADSGLAGLPLPDRATGSVAAAPRALPLRTTREVVVVRRGDSLWSITAGVLGPDASDAQIGRAWRRLHHVNADRIGDDPDLILPGTRLLVPDHIAPHGKEAL